MLIVFFVANSTVGGEGMGNSVVFRRNLILSFQIPRYYSYQDSENFTEMEQLQGEAYYPKGLELTPIDGSTR